MKPLTEPFPIETYALQKVMSDAQEVGISNVELSTRYDYLLEGMIVELRARLVGSHPQTTMLTDTVEIPVQSRGNALRIWLREDIARGHVIRRFWPGPRVKTTTHTLSADMSYSTHFCPHINIQDRKTHVDFLMQGGQ